MKDRRLLTMPEAAAQLGIVAQRPARAALKIIRAREVERGVSMLVRSGTGRATIFRVSMTSLRRYFPEVVRPTATDAETAIRAFFRGLDHRLVQLEDEQSTQRAALAAMTDAMAQLLATAGSPRRAAPRVGG